MTFEERMNRFNELVKNSNYIVFFGGAGVSTESGIPDFRSADGLYNKKDIQFEDYTPEYLLSHDCWWKEPKVFYEFYKQKLDVRNVNPNIAHKVLADMEVKGKLKAVITQNIDGLHQKAGSVEVCEIHGTTQRNYCCGCFEPYPADYLFNCEEEVPKCLKCGGRIRPDVTLYEESLPQNEWNKAYYHISNADLVIVGGTSLAVYPATHLVQGCEAPIVLINRDEVKLKLNTAVTFTESLGEVFGKLKY